MYTSHTILDFNLIFIFKFALKCTLTSFKFLFCVFKNHIVDMIQLVLIKIRFNIFMWSLFSTYFLVFLQEYFINCNVNNIIILLVPVKYISVCRIVPTVLSRPTFRILRTKVSQEHAFILWITRAMDEACGLGPILPMVYISFPALVIYINHIGVSILWGGFLYI